MRPVTVLGLLAGAVVSVSASALTTTVPPSQRLCFYADVDKTGEKIGVSLSLYCNVTAVLTHYLVLLRCMCWDAFSIPNILLMTPQVQSGGDFDIDYEVKDPTGEQILDGQVCLRVHLLGSRLYLYDHSVERTSRGFRLHRKQNRRILVLLRKRHVLLHRETC